MALLVSDCPISVVLAVSCGVPSGVTAVVGVTEVAGQLVMRWSGCSDAVTPPPA